MGNGLDRIVPVVSFVYVMSNDLAISILRLIQTRQSTVLFIW